MSSIHKQKGTFLKKECVFSMLNDEAGSPRACFIIQHFNRGTAKVDRSDLPLAAEQGALYYEKRTHAWT